MAASGGNMALSVLLRAVDRVSAPVRRVQTRLGAFRRQAEAIGRRVGFERLTSSLTRAGAAGKELYNTTGRIVRRLTLIGTIGVGALMAATVATASMGSQTANTADMLGIHVERLQELRYAAERAGMSQQNFDLALRRMLRRTSEAAQGGGAAKAALEELGLSAEALTMKRPEQQMAIVADALNRVEGDADRLRLAFNLFDSDGAAMVNVLRGGSEALEHTMRRARQFGHVMSESAVRQAERFDSQMLDLRKSMLGVRVTLGTALMPLFSQWAVQLTELITRHQPQIQAWARNFAAGLPGRLAQLRDEFNALVERLQPVIQFGSDVVERFGAVNTAAAALGVVIGAPLIVPLLKMGLALGSVGLALGQVSWGLSVLAVKAVPLLLGALKGLAVAAMAHPIVALVVAVAGGAALLIANWDKVGPWFRDLWARLPGYAASAWEAIKGFLSQDPLDLMAAGFQRARDWLAGIDWRAAAETGWEAMKLAFRWSPLGLVVRGFTAARDWVQAVGWREAASVGWEAMKFLFRWSPLGLMVRGFGAALEWLGGVDWRAVAQGSWEVFKTLFKWSPLGLISAGIGRAATWLGNQDWAAHGRALLETLTAGIRRAAAAPVEAVRGVLSRLRNLLPFSDAREGPLASLTASGRAIPSTLAEGVRAGRPAFLRTVTGLVDSVHEALSGAWQRVRGWFGGGGVDAQAQVGLGELPELPVLEGEARYRVVLGELPALPELSGRARYQVLLGAIPALPVLVREALYQVVLGKMPVLPDLRGRARYRVLLGEIPSLPALMREAMYRVVLGDIPVLPDLRGHASYDVVLGPVPVLPELRGQVVYELAMRSLPVLPALPGVEGDAQYRATVAGLPELPELRGRALFVAEIVGFGQVLDALRDNAIVVVPEALRGPAVNDDDAAAVRGPALGDSEDADRLAPEPALGRDTAAEPEWMMPARGGVQVQRIDFRPEVTIQVGDNATAQEIADLVDERLERMRNRDLWEQVQGVQEASG